MTDRQPRAVPPLVGYGMKTLKTLVEWFSADHRADYILALSALVAIGAMVAGLVYRACLGEPLPP